MSLTFLKISAIFYISATSIVIAVSPPSIESGMTLFVTYITDPNAYYHETANIKSWIQFVLIKYQSPSDTKRDELDLNDSLPYIEFLQILQLTFEISESEHTSLTKAIRASTTNPTDSLIHQKDATDLSLDSMKKIFSLIKNKTPSKNKFQKYFSKHTTQKFSLDEKYFHQVDDPVNHGILLDGVTNFFITRKGTQSTNKKNYDFFGRNYLNFILKLELQENNTTPDSDNNPLLVKFSASINNSENPNTLKCAQYKEKQNERQEKILEEVWVEFESLIKNKNKVERWPKQKRKKQQSVGWTSEEKIVLMCWLVDGSALVLFLVYYFGKEYIESRMKKYRRKPEMA